MDLSRTLPTGAAFNATWETAPRFARARSRRPTRATSRACTACRSKPAIAAATGSVATSGLIKGRTLIATVPGASMPAPAPSPIHPNIPQDALGRTLRMEIGIPTKSDRRPHRASALSAQRAARHAGAAAAGRGGLTDPQGRVLARAGHRAGRIGAARRRRAAARARERASVADATPTHSGNPLRCARAPTASRLLRRTHGGARGGRGRDHQQADSGYASAEARTPSGRPEGRSPSDRADARTPSDQAEPASRSGRPGRANAWNDTQAERTARDYYADTPPSAAKKARTSHTCQPVEHDTAAGRRPVRRCVAGSSRLAVRGHAFALGGIRPVQRRPAIPRPTSWARPRPPRARPRRQQRQPPCPLAAACCWARCPPPPRSCSAGACHRQHADAHPHAGLRDRLPDSHARLRSPADSRRPRKPPANHRPTGPTAAAAAAPAPQQQK